MNTAQATMDQWLNSLVDSTEEVIRTGLGFKGVRTLNKQATVPKNGYGAYMPLLSDDLSLHIAISSDLSGCQILAKALLGLGPEAKNLSEPDIADAMGEIANMIAGLFKRQMTAEYQGLKLGIPVFVVGHIGVAEVQEMVVAKVRMGPVTAT